MYRHSTNILLQYSEREIDGIKTSNITLSKKTKKIAMSKWFNKSPMADHFIKIFFLKT
jgi:hypothetical protein